MSSEVQGKSTRRVPRSEGREEGREGEGQGQGQRAKAQARGGATACYPYAARGSQLAIELQSIYSLPQSILYVFGK